MKKYLLVLAALCAFTVLASAQLAPPAIPAPAVTTPAAGIPSPEAFAAMVKERDEARGQAAALQQQQQQTSIVAEYYKAVAERNEAILRVNALQGQLTQAQGEIATLKAAALPKPATPSK